MSNTTANRKRIGRKAAKRKAQALGFKRKAALWGHNVKAGIDGSLWFGPSGQLTKPVTVPVESIVSMAQKAAHLAICHRNRYPLRGL